jgi:hypothetical protein
LTGISMEHLGTGRSLADTAPDDRDSRFSLSRLVRDRRRLTIFLQGHRFDAVKPEDRAAIRRLIVLHQPTRLGKQRLELGLAQRCRNHSDRLPVPEQLAAHAQ